MLNREQEGGIKINKEQNLEQRVGIFERIRQGIGKNSAAYITAAAIALGAAVYSSCGDKEESFCCEKLNCGGGYVCLEQTPDYKGLPDVYCVDDNDGKTLECCECMVYTPPAPSSNEPHCPKC